MRIYNRPLISEFPGSLYQNEVSCSTFLVEMSFICMRMKNHFHIKGWAPNLVLIQRPGGTRKWPIRGSSVTNWTVIYFHPEHQHLGESARGFASWWARREYEVCPIAAGRRLGRELLSRVPRDLNFTRTGWIIKQAALKSEGQGLWVCRVFPWATLTIFGSALILN